MGLGHREASGNGTPCRGPERKPDEPPRANRNTRQPDSRDAKQPELLRGPEVRTGGPRDTSDNRNNLTKKNWLYCLLRLFPRLRMRRVSRGIPTRARVLALTWCL